MASAFASILAGGGGASAGLGGTGLGGGGGGGVGLGGFFFSSTFSVTMSGGFGVSTTGGGGVSTTGGGGGAITGGGAADSGTADHSSADATATSGELRQCRPHTSAPISDACAMIEMVTPVLHSSFWGGRSSGRGARTLLNSVSRAARVAPEPLRALPRGAATGGARGATLVRAARVAPEPITIPQLAARVNDLQGGRADVPVIIAGDKTVRYESIVKVMDTLQRAGVQRVGLAVKQVG